MHLLLKKSLKYAVICICLIKNGQNMHLHMQVYKCITILSLVIMFAYRQFLKSIKTNANCKNFC
jgi:hypothetical protein